MDDLDKLVQTLPENEQCAVAKRADELVTAHNLRELRATRRTGAGRRVRGEWF